MPEKRERARLLTEGIRAVSVFFLYPSFSSSRFYFMIPMSLIKRLPE